MNGPGGMIFDIVQSKVSEIKFTLGLSDEGSTYSYRLHGYFVPDKNKNLFLHTLYPMRLHVSSTKKLQFLTVTES